MNRILGKVICILLSLFSLASCVRDGEKLENCGAYIRFIYDYNLKKTDLFPAQGKKVSLFLFNEKGIFVKEKTAENVDFATYVMYVDIPDGKYKAVAWAGLYDESYEWASLTPGVSSINDLTLQLKNYTTNTLDKELHALWYGSLPELVVGTSIENYIVSLTKDTKKFRVVMQNMDDEGNIDVNNYDFKITMANGLYDNENTPSGNVITYKPYYTKNDAEGAGAIAEMNTLRIMKDKESRLIITHKITGKEVINLSLPKYLNALRLMEYQSMPLQEYLDREDSFAFVLLMRGLNNDGSFASFQVMINEWYIREQEMERKP